MEGLTKIYISKIQGKFHNQVARGLYFFKTQVWVVTGIYHSSKQVGATWVWVSPKTCIQALTC